MSKWVALVVIVAVIASRVGWFREEWRRWHR